MNNTAPSAADLRVAIARSWRRPLYHLAPLVGVHPTTLSKVLREHATLRPELAARIVAVLQATEAARD